MFARGLDDYQHGRLEEAQREADAILTGSQLHDSTRSYAGAYRLAGDVAFGQGRYEAAEAYFQKSLHIWTQLESKDNVPELWEAIGNVQISRSQLDKALISMRTALQKYRERKNLVGEAMARRGLGAIAFARGDLATAKEQFVWGKKLINGLNEPDMDCDFKGRLAKIHARQGNLPLALSELTECLSYWQAHQSHRWVALLELEIGTLFAQQSNALLATSYLIRSENGFRFVGDKANEERARQARLSLQRVQTRLSSAPG